MPRPLHVPRINNNDDTVRVVRLIAGIGQLVRQGEVVAEVETDKAVADVVADRDGYVLKYLCGTGDQVAVGSVMTWIGSSADEPVDDPDALAAESARGEPAMPTAKARALLSRHSLAAEEVPVSGNRLSAADVEAFVARRGVAASPRRAPVQGTGPRPLAAGILRPMTVEERGMLHTVSWHRDQAVATYLELEFDPGPWAERAAEYASEEKLMMSPLLPLLAHRLARLAAETPKLNATLLDGQFFQYSQVNLGYTVQAGETLYLVVIRNAGSMDAAGFIDALGEIQRHAIGRRLRPEESQGATVAFSSMARWDVSRHIPILPPFTSLMVAHAAPRRSGAAVLGATYDHRVLSGFDVVRLLQKLSCP